MDRCGHRGPAPAPWAGRLRPDDRAGPGRHRCRWMHHQSPLWRRGGRSQPGGSGKQGLKRSTVVDAQGIPLGIVAAAANDHDSPLLVPTLDTLDALGPLPEQMTAHLDRGYDSGVTRARLAVRGRQGEIAEKGKPAPVTAGKRWVVERTNAWMNAYKKLVWCTERRGRV